MTSSNTTETQTRSAKEWVQVLAKYREPSIRRSILELAATLVPFAALTTAVVTHMPFRLSSPPLPPLPLKTVVTVFRVPHPRRV